MASAYRLATLAGAVVASEAAALTLRVAVACSPTQSAIKSLVISTWISLEAVAKVIDAKETSRLPLPALLVIKQGEVTCVELQAELPDLTSLLDVANTSSIAALLGGAKGNTTVTHTELLLLLKISTEDSRRVAPAEAFTALILKRVKLLVDAMVMGNDPLLSQAVAPDASRMVAEKEAVGAMEMGLVIAEMVRDVIAATGALMATKTIIVLVPKVLFLREQGKMTALILHCMALKSAVVMSAGKVMRMEYPLARGELLPREKVQTAVAYVCRGRALTEKEARVLAWMVMGQLSACSSTQLLVERVLMEKPVVGVELGLVTPAITTTNFSIPASAPVRKEDSTSVFRPIEQVGALIDPGKLVPVRVRVLQREALFAAVMQVLYSGGKTICMESVVMSVTMEVEKVKVQVATLPCRLVDNPMELMVRVCLFASCREQQVVESIRYRLLRQVLMVKLVMFLHSLGRASPLMVIFTAIWPVLPLLMLKATVLLAEKKVNAGELTRTVAMVMAQLAAVVGSVSSGGKVRQILSVFWLSSENWKFNRTCNLSPA